ncbi:MAG: hypothetical protein JJ921_12720 [Pseudomonadales bacterium]|nr:hypothetical protein [Pseudomonadales bacterium]MBO7006196.1 hypothetical protein [Pseudomonadales bacterium]
MNLEQLANIAEIFGNLVVVITIIYVALQVHQGSAALRSDSRQAQVNTDLNGVYLFVQYPELGKYFSQQETPSFEEKTKLMFWIIAQMRAREHEWMQYKTGALDEKAWLSYRDVIYFILGTSRSRSLWELCSSYFDADFAAMVEEMMCDIPEIDFWAKIHATK